MQLKMFKGWVSLAAMGLYDLIKHFDEVKFYKKIFPT
jgi:hypothetical protein